MKEKRRSRVVVFFVFVFFISGFGFGEAATEFEKGVIIDRVNCIADHQQSYALYLPGRFNPDSKWPVLFAFDPGGRSRIPLELFQRAAEKFGVIVVCPTNAKNGPWQPILDAMKTSFTDTRNRFPFDLNRIYTTGFSGGSRAAAAFLQVLNVKVRGIIACGAGLPSPMKPEQVNVAFYHGIVGLEDFNYKEMVKLDRAFGKIGIKHFVEVVEGKHAWPSEDTCFRALEGMEIRAMKDGLRPPESGLVQQAFDSAVVRAMGLEKSGNIYQAVRYYEYINGLFQGFKDLRDIRDKIKELSSGKAFRKFAKEEDKRNREEWDFIARFVGVFNTIKKYEAKSMDLRNILNDLGIPYLNRQAEKSKNIYKRALALRLLRELELKGCADGAHYMEKGDTGRAIIFYEVAAAADNSGARAFYRLARIYARLGDKRKALKNLKILVDNLRKEDYRDFSFLTEEKDLEPIRNEKEFVDLLSELGLKK